MYDIFIHVMSHVCSFAQGIVTSLVLTGYSNLVKYNDCCIVLPVWRVLSNLRYSIGCKKKTFHLAGSQNEVVNGAAGLFLLGQVEWDLESTL